MKISDFGYSIVADHEKFLKPSFTNTDHLPDPTEPITEKADVYSYASILWEMYYIPTTRDANNKMEEELIKKEKEVDPSWDPAFAALIKKCWAPDRPSFAEIVENLEVQIAAGTHLLFL